MAVVEPLAGQSRVTVFRMFGTVYGYATHSLDSRNIGEVAIVGPLTPGVEWGRLWDTARKMCRETEGPADHARWIMAQASRSFACGSDVVVKLSTGTWKVTQGRRAELNGYCYRDHLWTGNLTVEEVTPDQVAAYEPIYKV
ncbi:hypothetical protein [Streptomyces sp. NPDC048551]|uniref:hypothetical protein n=1 Tax=Streptomyces sp. NPDC048551 TaxID=3155758 RepID=UPI003412994E